MKKLPLIALLISSSYSPAASKPTFEEPFRISSNGEPIAIDEGYTYPAFVDLSKDGIKDLVVGEYRQGGQIFYYKNMGSKSSPKYAKAKNLKVGREILTVPGVGH